MTGTDKEHSLSAFFEKQKSVLIAFSGGVDSSLLAAFAAAAGIKALAVTVKTELVSEREIQNASETADEIGIPHLIIEKKMLEIPEIKNNQKKRCYACKKEMFEMLLKYAEDSGFETVIEGTNNSDRLMNDSKEIPRPGYSALLELKENRAGKKPKIETPLADLKMTKEEIREAARRKKLSNADKPSMSCLAARFSYETQLTSEMLKTIDTAEQMIENIGARQIRIRRHTDDAGRNIARVEVGKEEEKIFFEEKNQKKIEEFIAFLKRSGFSYVTIDLEGFRSGSMDI
ncbi:MAG: ATP-dependent sacrificial sulfur transferase LarE [Methanosarcinales archaeon]|jgi:uncharacterized protein|nr:ATP-dependent sacrificial sulfur transferase LarE [Methanosarcinales archaeon]